MLIILMGIYINFTALEIIVLCITIASVLAAEMVNTAVELVVDMIKSEYHPIARIVKDVSAGAVLIMSINAIVVAYLLFSRKFPFRIEETLLRLKQSPWHITFIVLIIVLSLTILGKIIFHKGTPLRGGMPSGHSAIAFSIWAIVAYATNDSLLTVLVFLLAFLIARERVKTSVHTILEVLAGALLGFLVTTIVFQILY